MKLTTELMDRKFEQRFNLLDTDHDGCIGRNDFEEVVRNFIANFGESPISPKGMALRDAYVNLWHALAINADADRDGRITREEFAAALMGGGLTSDVGFRRAVEPVAEAMVALVDTNGDGIIDLDEYTRMVASFGVPGTQARDAFSMLDRDGDGALTVDEVTEAMREFYTSRDPQAPGNWLFGRI